MKDSWATSCEDTEVSDAVEGELADVLADLDLEEDHGP